MVFGSSELKGAEEDTWKFMSSIPIKNIFTAFTIHTEQQNKYRKRVYRERLQIEHKKRIYNTQKQINMQVISKRLTRSYTAKVKHVEKLTN